MNSVGITGGTGMVGTQLAKLLAGDGYNVVIFTRKPDKSRKYIKNTTYAEWNPAKKKVDTAKLATLDAMVHLAGEGIADKRWTEQRKTDIVHSRVLATDFLTEQLLQHAPNCKVVVCASAIGYYGADNGHEPFKENEPPDMGFLGHTCKLWEAASEPLQKAMRRVVFRFGIVLSATGGAFTELKKPLTYGVMPILGGGDQVVSWIHVEDLVRMIRFAIERPEVTGAYNAVSPTPVSHSLMMHTIARKKGTPRIMVPVPGFVLKIAVGEVATELLKSCTVSAAKIMDKGFKYLHPDIDNAVVDILAINK